VRTTRALLTLLPLIAACGTEELEFLETYNTLRCEHILACGDEAQLRFEGILSQETCEDRSLEDLSEWGLGCRYRPTAAQECLFAMETLTCPGDGALAERPPACQTVYFDCSDLPDETEDPGGDTDGGDTDATE
jgi:hypothetical protein